MNKMDIIEKALESDEGIRGIAEAATAKMVDPAEKGRTMRDMIALMRSSRRNMAVLKAGR